MVELVARPRSEDFAEAQVTPPVPEPGLSEPNVSEPRRAYDDSSFAGHHTKLTELVLQVFLQSNAKLTRPLLRACLDPE